MSYFKEVYDIFDGDTYFQVFDENGSYVTSGTFNEMSEETYLELRNRTVDYCTVGDESLLIHLEEE